MTVLHRFVCVGSAIAIVAACSAASSPGNTISPIEGAGGSSGAGAASSGASANAGTAGKSPQAFVTAPDPNSGGPGGPVITMPIQTVDASTTKQCSGARSKGKEVTIDIFIMFDQSLSMSCALPTPSDGTAGAAGAAGAAGTAGSSGSGGAPAAGSGGSAGAAGAATNTMDRWDAVKGALQEFLTAPSAAGINVGIQYFGLGGTPNPFLPYSMSSCNAPDYQGAAVEIAPLPGNATPIINSLDMHQPSTNTPTAPALTGAINHAIGWKNMHPDDAVIVLLVTDGEPGGCPGTVADVANVAKQGLMSSIPTYVIGITSPGTTCMWDPAPPNQQDLDSVANAGGTGASLIVDLSKDVVQQFLDTMDKIRAKANPPCQYTLPPPPDGQHTDPMKVNVEYTPPGAAMGTTLLSVPSQAACDPSKGGWYYDDPNTPKTVTLCPASCSTVTADVTGLVDIELGCKTITAQ
ncbi:MAG TPA: vWA domain-containing protein [Polyangiaceae bacterium]|nr:vWA domain-containing protein [Polyangiaceae bacterium]